MSRWEECFAIAIVSLGFALVACLGIGVTSEAYINYLKATDEIQARKDALPKVVTDCPECTAFWGNHWDEPLPPAAPVEEPAKPLEKAPKNWPKQPIQGYDLGCSYIDAVTLQEFPIPDKVCLDLLGPMVPVPPDPSQPPFLKFSPPNPQL